MFCKDFMTIGNPHPHMRRNQPIGIVALSRRLFRGTDITVLALIAPMWRWG